jgi:ribosomal protein S12 methylthiotransferase accessory factor YcaO
MSGVANGSEANSELEQLCRRYPLSSRWSRPTLYAETVHIGTVSVELCGVVTTGHGETLTGSAGGVGERPLARAYFELLERTSVVEAGKSVDLLRLLNPESGVLRTAIPREIFQQSNDPTFRYARSNGVAGASSWASACSNARWELIERDRVLRSWYGQTRPLHCRELRLPSLVDLDAFYESCVYSFPGASAVCRGEVAGVFAFPKVAGAPLSYGFAAQPDLARAIRKAGRECVQRIGFLWGEEVSADEPAFVPNAEYHQEYYLRPHMHDALRAWLEGDHLRLACEIEPRLGVRQPEEFVDVTMQHLRGSFFVAKILPRDELELGFGHGNPRVRAPLPRHLLVHPIA